MYRQNSRGNLRVRFSYCATTATLLAPSVVIQLSSCDNTISELMMSELSGVLITGLFARISIGRGEHVLRLFSSRAVSSNIRARAAKSRYRWYREVK